MVVNRTNMKISNFFPLLDCWGGVERERERERIGLAGDLRSEPLHDMKRGFNELKCQLHQYRDTETTRAYATQQDSDDPDEDANDGDEETQEGEGKAQKKAQRPAISVATTHDDD